MSEATFEQANLQLKLYDLRRDPYEMRNLIADASVRGTLDSLRAELQRLKQ